MPNPQLPTATLDSVNLNLIKIPDMTEFKSALFSIDSSKTSGHDGFGAGFFKQYWDLIKMIFSNA